MLKTESLIIKGEHMEYLKLIYEICVMKDAVWETISYHLLTWASAVAILCINIVKTRKTSS